MRVEMLEAVLDYHRRGWSIIPIRRGTKIPACRSWKPYQSERASEVKLRRWFGSNGDKEVAVICGEVSGGLVVRDFDDMESYDRWKAGHPELARVLPTVATGRPGRHVYFTADMKLIRAQSASGSGIIICGDGELRGGGYVLLPPSKHPSGEPYRWIVALGDEIPEVDLFSSGLLPCDRENRDNRGLQRITEEIGGVGSVNKQKPTQIQKRPEPSNDWSEEIQWAIVDSLPNGPGKRHTQVFKMARALKAIPALADASPKDLKPIVQRWHELALPVISTKPFEETWIDFLRGWPKVKFPKGEEPMVALFATAAEADLPEAALQYEQHPLRLLVALCRELQRAAGEGPFYLSCRTAARLLGVDHATTARWLFLLVNEEVLDEVSKGSQATRRASRYRYLGEL